jgi:hypothetical protein
MAWFGKKYGDVGVVDLSDLQRRGIYKPKTLPKKVITPTDNQGYADLSKITPQQNQTTQTSVPEKPANSGGFFDWFGGGAPSSTNSSAIASSSEYVHAQNDSSTLKTKIEDVEFKIENLSRKINNFLERLELLEKKVGRLEGSRY